MTRLSDLIRSQQCRTKPNPSPDVDHASGARVATSPALEGIPEATPPATIDRTDWYRLAWHELDRLAQSVRDGMAQDLGDFPRLATGIATSVQKSDRLLIQALSGVPGSQLPSNPVNVSIIATKLGMGFQYDREQLEQLALAGLLHDIGMMSVPESIVIKQGPLTLSEREMIEQHPRVGAETLHRLGQQYSWVAQLVLQEHERWNGQGYPNNLRGTEIHPFAQIIGIADVLDALVSPRPYHHCMLPHEAVREIFVVEKGSFSRDVLKALMEQISMYPLGTQVKLSSGEIGTVLRLQPQYPLRPVIQIGAAGQGIPGRSKILDLSTTTLLHIVEVVKPVGAT